MTGSSQVQDGPGEEAPRLRPGTYDLTKRVEVDENGVARFVDMPDGPNAEYVAGFWHKTRSWVRSVADEEPAPVRAIPDEIVDAAAALLKNPDTYHLTTRELAVAVLSAALAGRTMREIPEQLQGVIRLEHCRACRDERDEIVTADFILWGKLLPPEQMGPRCYDHTAGYLGYRAMSQIDQWAVFDLRPFNQMLASGSRVGDQP